MSRHSSNERQFTRRAFFAGLGLAAAAAAAGCATDGSEEAASEQSVPIVSDAPASGSDAANEDQADATAEPSESDDADAEAALDEARAALNLSEDYRESFVHGEKPAEFQKYIVMHDTEGESSAASVIDWWDSNGNLVAAHFIVNKDGSIWQCVPLSKICHHAGFGDTGHNEAFGVEDESRDDRLGTTPIGSWAADYGMNSYSVGIEMVHVGGSGGYPEAQLDAVDALIAYIDAWCVAEGAEPSQIIDHKAWRTGNSDTSAEFADYLANLQDRRTCR